MRQRDYPACFSPLVAYRYPPTVKSIIVLSTRYGNPHLPPLRTRSTGILAGPDWTRRSHTEVLRRSLLYNYQSAKSIRSNCTNTNDYEKKISSTPLLPPRKPATYIKSSHKPHPNPYFLLNTASHDPFQSSPITITKPTSCISWTSSTKRSSCSGSSSATHGVATGEAPSCQKPSTWTASISTRPRRHTTQNAARAAAPAVTARRSTTV